MGLLLDLLALVRALAADRARLALENTVLRQQMNILRRSVKRPRLDDSDRLFWVLICRLFRDWREHLVLVTPETVIRCGSPPNDAAFAETHAIDARHWRTSSAIVTVGMSA